MEHKSMVGVMGDELGKFREKEQEWGGRQTKEPGLTIGTLEGFQQASSLIRHIFSKDTSREEWEQTERASRRKAGKSSEETAAATWAPADERRAKAGA